MFNRQSAQLSRQPKDAPRPPLWLDAPDAAQRVSAADVPESYRQAAMDLILRGFTILRGAQDGELCSQTIADYHTYSDQNRAYVDANLDEAGREKRLVNFHHYSDAAMQLGTNPEVMNLLDFLFGSEASVYTSLTFKYGTGQPVHRDTPHFATWPNGYFFGVWTALEDISPDAGPLFYHEGAHHFSIDVARIWRETLETRSDLSPEQAYNHALDIYNGMVIDRAPNEGAYRVAEMKRGDVALWHPMTPHGGSPANDPNLSRWSCVFHCAPSSVQVHQHPSFFDHAGREEPPPRYGFTEAHGRQIALAGDVGFM